MKTKNFHASRLILPTFAIGLALCLLIIFFILSKRTINLRCALQKTHAAIAAMPNGRILSNGEHCEELRTCISDNVAVWHDLLRRQRGAIPFHVEIGRDPQRVDAYPQILAGTKFLRDLADEKNIPLLEGESFGFLKFGQPGQNSDGQFQRLLMEEQCIVAILYLLFSAGDNDLKFLHLRREAVGASDRQNAIDFFSTAKHSLFRNGGRCSSFVFNLRFRSFTATFQRFLDALNGHGFPVLLRAISVETPIVDAHASPTGEWLALDPQLSEFDLVLEWLEPQNFCGCDRSLDGTFNR